jgi:hypothetical protein
VRDWNRGRKGADRALSETAKTAQHLLPVQGVVRCRINLMLFPQRSVASAPRPH